MFKRFGYVKISAMERNMGRKAGAGRPFGCGLSADTRTMEGGPPLVLWKRASIGMLITKIASFENLNNYI